jgi:hypothetical protein
MVSPARREGEWMREVWSTAQTKANYTASCGNVRTCSRWCEQQGARLLSVGGWLVVNETVWQLLQTISDSCMFRLMFESVVRLCNLI